MFTSNESSVQSVVQNAVVNVKGLLQSHLQTRNEHYRHFHEMVFVEMNSEVQLCFLCMQIT